MSISFIAFSLLLLTSICACADTKNVIQSYIIQKDLFSVAKAGEFSIYDPTGKELQYRLNSRYSILQNVELTTHPSRQVIAKLNKKFHLLFYKGIISILDSRTNQWIDGTIREKFIGHFIIEWNGQRVKMIFPFPTWTVEFRDDKDGTLLASYDKKLISLVWANKYELKVYSDKLPHAIYFLGLAARDHKMTQMNNKNGKK